MGTNTARAAWHEVYVFLDGQGIEAVHCLSEGRLAWEPP